MHAKIYVDKCQNAADFIKSVTVLDAVRWIHSAWENISVDTIRKCFVRSGFPLCTVNDMDNVQEESIGIEQTIENLPEYIKIDLPPIDQFSIIDDHIVVHEEIPDNENAIFQDVLCQLESIECTTDDSDNEENDTITEVRPPITANTALHYIDEITRYITHHQPDLLEDILKLKTKVEQSVVNSSNLKQTTISDFFMA